MGFGNVGTGKEARRRRSDGRGEGEEEEEEEEELEEGERTCHLPSLPEHPAVLPWPTLLPGVVMETLHAFLLHPVGTPARCGYQRE